MASFLAAVVALAVVALVSAMWRAAARRDEARRLAWLAERDAYYYNGHHAAFEAPLWTAPGVGAAWSPVEHQVAWAPVEHQVSWSPVEHQVAWPPVEHQVSWPPVEQQVAWPPVEHEVALPPVEQVAAAEPTAPSVEQKVACPPVEQVAAAAETTTTAPSAAGKKGSCAVCLKPTSFRCKSCKSVKYCTVKCQIGHWRQGHKDKCHPLSAVDSKASVVAGVEQAVESKEMPLEFTFPQVTGHEESAVCSSFPAFGKSCIIEGGSVSENVSHTQIPSACDPSKKADDLPETVGSEIRAAVPNNLPKKTKSLIRQQSAPTVVMSYPSESTLFPYERFIKLYNFDKVELRPFGLCNLGNSCYANVVLQCLLFTRPLTAYLLEGLHSKNCSQKEWCFLCELEKLIMEGKKGQSQLSPTGILSHLLDIGSSFGLGKEEDAHEFLRYAIDTMQSASMKEANIKGAHKLAEETTLMQLMFGGYLRSKIKCTKCRVSSEHCERILDLTVEIDGDISTLEEALHRFTSSEVLDGDNRYHCTRCKSYERAKKKLTISEAPNILTIALKRYQSGMSGKINKAIRFPEYLNLSSYMSTTDDCSPVYRLYAVVVHRDVTNSSSCGHYVCYVKDTKGKWYETDDSQVKSASLENVRSECAYMLLYARFSPRAPRSLRKLIIAQGPSRMRKARQISDAEPTCLEGRSYFSRHQRAQSQSCKDHLVNDSTCTLDRSSTTQSEGSSLISNSDATGNFSTDASTASTRNSGNMEEYDYICGTSDKMHPVSTVVIPEEYVLNYSRQMSSLNPSSSTQCADQGQVDGLQQLKHQASQRVRGEGLEIPSFFYNEQGVLYGQQDPGARIPSPSHLTQKPEVQI